MKAVSPEASFAPATEITRIGRDPARFDGFVNTPVVRGSTVLSASYDDLVNHRGRYSYGRRGNPTSEALEQAISRLEGAAGTVLTPSGLSAVSVALLSVLESGDHLLMVDTAYNPTRKICDGVLARYGIEVSYYDPQVGAGIVDLLRPNTRAIFLESPGSQSMEVQDVPAIVSVARERGITTLIDNTWATPLFLKPLEMGGGRVDHGGHEICVRPFRCESRHHCGQCADVEARAPDPWRHGNLREPGRCRPRAARPAHHAGAAGAPLEIRH